MYVDTMLCTACRFSSKIFYGGRKRPGKEWFDNDCFVARKAARGYLRAFLQSTLDVDKQNYLSYRNKYKKRICDLKKKTDVGRVQPCAKMSETRQNSGIRLKG